MRRAAHQVVDGPLVLEDPWAVKILAPLLAVDGLNYEQKRAKHAVSKAFRSYMVARSRYAEDELKLAFDAGVRQYVVLGAGLDTFALRCGLDGLRVFEVDFPATQEWKRELMAEAGIAVPERLKFAAVDFEHQTLAEGLARAGLDAGAPAFFSWLGVTMYLTPDGFRATLGFIGERPAGSAVSLDFTLPKNLLGMVERVALDRLAKRVEQAGEPFTLFFSEAEMAEEFRRAGFTRWEMLGAEAVNEKYFQNRTDGLKLVGGAVRLATAWR
jgi:methyltransferase (TIGR00027 family)